MKKTPAEIEASILKLIDNATGYQPVAGYLGSRVEPWPGLPTGHLDRFAMPIVNDLIRRGLIEEVNRPKLVDPTKLAHFYRRTAA